LSMFQESSTVLTNYRADLPSPDIPAEDDEEEFDDWIDKFYGFAHFINPSCAIPSPYLPPPATTSNAALLFNAESDAHAPSSSLPEPEPEPPPPITTPRNSAAIRQDDRLLAVRLWHATLRRPPDLDDVQYTRFLRYCAEFFVASNKLWRKNVQGYHKLVLFPELHLSTLRSAHDDLGHKGFYATARSSLNVSGGLSLLVMLSGSSALVTSARSVKHALFLSRLLSQFPRLYLPKCTWTPCTCRLLEASIILRRDAARLLIIPNSACCVHNLLRL
jgi:hypothetical protein